MAVLHWELEGARERHRVDDHFTPERALPPAALQPRAARYAYPHGDAHAHANATADNAPRAQVESPGSAETTTSTTTMGLKFLEGLKQAKDKTYVPTAHYYPLSMPA
jgi:hypothetical protein